MSRIIEPGFPAENHREKCGAVKVDWDDLLPFSLRGPAELEKSAQESINLQGRERACPSVTEIDADSPSIDDVPAENEDRDRAVARSLARSKTDNQERGVVKVGVESS